ncbi:single-strand selective monofunctional uracil DNA glycosylase isoform X3 [Alligator mississippiensis]|uniref:single-strand selective monofunctional uracil DNA glycosylase isoform X3 n=1 Tax=Alligator mississippiensis TaxID=8496 RepID=UPI002877D3E1|nr:single-strand selective monofunctional uracil DNA glycosylase isoform X3 [Alligator mississippiensis]
MEGVAGPPSALPAVLAFLEGDSLAAQFLRAELELNARLRELKFPEPVCYVYNPLEYAWEPHQDYVRRYCRPSADVLFLGMNPGPFGMAQTGVPFGEVSTVRDWLQVGGHVGKPEREHPKRPVLGLACPQAEKNPSTVLLLEATQTVQQGRTLGALWIPIGNLRVFLVSCGNLFLDVAEGLTVTLRAPLCCMGGEQDRLLSHYHPCRLTNTSRR